MSGKRGGRDCFYFREGHLVRNPSFFWAPKILKKPSRVYREWVLFGFFSWWLYGIYKFWECRVVGFFPGPLEWALRF